MAADEQQELQNRHIELLNGLVEESPKYFDSDWIAELWAAIPNKIYEKENPFWLLRDGYKKQMEQAIIDGELEATTEERLEGFDDGFKEIIEQNRIRKIQNGRLGKHFVSFSIYRDKFKDWLVTSKQWPLTDDCLLSKWLEGEPQAEIVGDIGTANNEGTETKPLNQNSNNSDFSGLLNIPSRIDDWVSVIDDMTRDFHAKFGKMPNYPQAWSALCKSPPEGYEITTGKDRGEVCLTMQSAKPLSRSAFSKRWKSYTNKA
jgi:hypothetical protein